MRLSPIYRKDELISSRSYTLPLMITALNTGLTILVLINLFSVSANAASSGEVSYASFLRMYYIFAGAEYILLMIVAPTITSSAISAEREHRTLGLLLTTQLSPWDIVTGKLLGALSTVLTMMVSSIPVLITVFIYGGVTWRQLLMVGVLYVFSFLYAAAIGLTASSFIRTTAASMAVSYVAIIASLAGMFLLYYFRRQSGFSGHVLFLLVMCGLLLLSGIMLWLCRRRLMPVRKRREGKNERSSG